MKSEVLAKTRREHLRQIGAGFLEVGRSILIIGIGAVIGVVLSIHSEATVNLIRTVANKATPPQSLVTSTARTWNRYQIVQARVSRRVRREIALHVAPLVNPKPVMDYPRQLAGDLGSKKLPVCADPGQGIPASRNIPVWKKPAPVDHPPRFLSGGILSDGIAGETFFR